MNKIVFSFLIVALVGCGSNIPRDEQAITSNSVIRYDSFRNLTWIETPMYISRQGVTDMFPVSIMFRSLYKEGKQIFIQLYVTKMDAAWGFYHSAYGEDGYQFKFADIDSTVDPSSGTVYVTEHFALSLSRKYLDKMSVKDWSIKVYGKRNEGVFIVPMQLTKGFVSKLHCFEAKQCK